MIIIYLIIVSLFNFTNSFKSFIQMKYNDKNKQFIWEKQWYPIAVEEYTDKKKSQKVSFLGNNIIIWYNGNKWCTFEDKCPHRGVPLSEGRIEKTNELLCAYHAWKFNGDGKCTSIPQSRTKEKEFSLINSPKSCVKSYPTQVNQGLIWVWGEKTTELEPYLKTPNLVEELTDPQYNGTYSTPIQWVFRDIPYGWDMFMENTLDPAHAPVSHHGIMGNRYKDPTFIEVTKLEDEEGLKYKVKNTVFNLNSSSKSLNSSFTTLNFRPPCLNKVVTDNLDGTKTILALYATPTKPGHCRFFILQLLINSKNNKKAKGIGIFTIRMPTWLLHILSNLFLHQDLVFLHHQERMLCSDSQYAFGNFDKKFNLTSNIKAYSKNYFMPNDDDKIIGCFRNWVYTKAGGGPIWGSNINELPKRLESHELFDVYESHTKNCIICQNALKKFNIVKNMSLLLIIISVLFIKNKIHSIISTCLFSCIFILSKKISGMFYKYHYYHQNNN
jgi:phenylpropionate dioxygenase-like ring-hydroxylating dioxygenase large terminal subunit